MISRSSLGNNSKEIIKHLKEVRKPFYLLDFVFLHKGNDIEVVVPFLSCLRVGGPVLRNIADFERESALGRTFDLET